MENEKMFQEICRSRGGTLEKHQLDWDKITEYECVLDFPQSGAKATELWLELMNNKVFPDENEVFSIKGIAGDSVLKYEVYNVLVEDYDGELKREIVTDLSKTKWIAPFPPLTEGSDVLGIPKFQKAVNLLNNLIWDEVSVLCRIVALDDLYLHCEESDVEPDYLVDSIQSLNNKMERAEKLIEKHKVALTNPTYYPL